MLNERLLLIIANFIMIISEPSSIPEREANQVSVPSRQKREIWVSEGAWKLPDCLPPKEQQQALSENKTKHKLKNKVLKVAQHELFSLAYSQFSQHSSCEIFPDSIGPAILLWSRFTVPLELSCSE